MKTTPVNLFNQHAAPVTVNGRSYTFRTAQGAEKFAAIVGGREQGITTSKPLELPAGDGIVSIDVISTAGKVADLPRCFASDVHLSALARLRMAPLPECLRREMVKSQLSVITTTEPTVPTPPASSPPLKLLPAPATA